jgi:protein gp37
MANSKIEWTDKTWNPVVGCQKISSGCQKCYAERMAKRLRAMGVKKYQSVVDNNGWTGISVADDDSILEPLKWKKPSRIFISSMGDLFANDWIRFDAVHVRVGAFIVLHDILSVIQNTPQHTYFILTKRPENMRQFVAWYVTKIGAMPKNLWLGVSVEDQKTADDRIPLLLQTQAAHRFISYEPALGPVEFLRYDHEEQHLYGPAIRRSYVVSKNTVDGPGEYYDDSYCGIDWIIAGCESGPHRRPADINWFRSVRDQCQAAGTPFFLKQMEVDGKLVKMPKLDDRVWDQT